MTSRARLGLLFAALVAVAVPGTAAAGTYPFRDEYVKTTTQHIFEVVTKDGKAVTDGERTAALDHWISAMRVVRVREVAEEEKDMSTVARADALLKKLDASFFKQLTKLNAKAPVEASLTPPTVLAPTGGQSMPLDGPFAITLAPYKGATKYFCAIRQAKHEWSNMHAPSSTPACTLDAADPPHRRFKAGHAEAIARALVKGAWSDEVKVPFEITGTAPPPATAGRTPAAATSGAAAQADPTGGSQAAPAARGTGVAQFDNVYNQSQGGGGIGVGLCPQDFSLKVSGGKVSAQWTPKPGPATKGRTAAPPVTPGGTLQGTVSASGILTASIPQDPAVILDGNFHCSSQGCYVNLGAKKGDVSCDMKILSQDWKHVECTLGHQGARCTKDSDCCTGNCIDGTHCY
jgi:hypothetical protein